VHTFSIPSGWTCPGAKECLARADKKTGKIVDGKKQTFRCFSASTEAYLTSVRDSRWQNKKLLDKAKTKAGMVDLILKSIPRTAKKIRIHVGGDFFSQAYFDAWVEVATIKEDIIFYAYTKSLNFWVKRMVEIPFNMRLTASRGGKFDHFIDTYELKYAEVVFSPVEAKELKLKIDHDDSHAMSNKVKPFALLLHGMQPQGSEASDAIKTMKKEGVQFEYSSK
jgi:hypothetical protein